MGIDRFFCHYTDSKIYPDEERKFTFSFFSEKNGVFSEEWFLATTPPLKNCDLHIHLSGLVHKYVDQYSEKVANFDSEIEKEANRVNINELVLDLVESIKATEPPIPNMKNENLFKFYFKLYNAEYNVEFSKRIMNNLMKLNNQVMNEILGIVEEIPKLPVEKPAITPRKEEKKEDTSSSPQSSKRESKKKIMRKSTLRKPTEEKDKLLQDEKDKDKEKATNVENDEESQHKKLQLFIQNLEKKEEKKEESEIFIPKDKVDEEKYWDTSIDILKQRIAQIKNPKHQKEFNDKLLKIRVDNMESINIFQKEKDQIFSEWDNIKNMKKELVELVETSIKKINISNAQMKKTLDNYEKQFVEVKNDIMSINEIYNKYLHPNILPITTDTKMWDALGEVSVINTFQFDSAEGSKAAKQLKPRTILEMADANGLIRLMGEEGQERPIDKYYRYKNDISLWYEEMDNFGLTKAEQKTLEPYFKQSYGVPPSQEQLMKMLMDKDICGFSLKEANDARRIVGKKQMSRIPELRAQVLERASSPRLGQYVWRYGAGPQMGYSFSVIHALAYSFIGAQTLYLGTHWNPIYWDTACLVVNSGSLEDAVDEDGEALYDDEAENAETEKKKKATSTDYGKVAKALNDIIDAGINVSLVDINKSDFGFKPDVKNNRILFGLKALLNVNDDLVNAIIKNRPYYSIKDFYQRVKPNKQAMISLIKAGAFDDMMDRKIAMAWFIWETCDKKSRLTLQNMATLNKQNMIPTDTPERELAYRVYEFNRYLKAACKKREYPTDFYLDTRAIEFLYELNLENLIREECLIDVKKWDNYYQSYMNVFREWLRIDGAEVLKELNIRIFEADWKKYALGSFSAWEM